MSETSDEELIERAERLKGRLRDFDEPVDVDNVIELVDDLCDRLAALTTPDLWRSPSEPPKQFEPVFVRQVGGQVHVGYADDGCDCGWVDHFRNRIPGITGWKPIVRPLP